MNLMAFKFYQPLLFKPHFSIFVYNYVKVWKFEEVPLVLGVAVEMRDLDRIRCLSQGPLSDTSLKTVCDYATESISQKPSEFSQQEYHTISG